MSESEHQHNDSPLQSERGVTTISNTVVSSIAGMAAREVEGVHMGGGASRTASGMLGSITGSESKTSGVSVEVGRTEVAIDLKMGIEYNKNILQTVEEVRRRITERVESMTGLRITELNATITDVTFPEKEQRRRLGSGGTTRELGSAEDTEPETRTIPEGERETTHVESRSRTYTESTSGPVPEEEGSPPEGDETAELHSDDTWTEEPRTEETSATSEEALAQTEAREVTETPEEQETRAEAETSEETEAEARRRRRAEERARRRRRTEDG